MQEESRDIVTKDIMLVTIYEDEISNASALGTKERTDSIMLLWN